MSRDIIAMAVIEILSVCLILFFVKKDQLRTAFFAFLLAQFFSWPTTLLYVQFGLQQNPVRLFPNATESNFLFAFIFHPAVYVVYFLYYPRSARKALKMLYTASMSLISPLALLAASLFTHLVFYPHKAVLLLSYAILLIIYSASRRYMDWYFSKLRISGKGW